MIKAQTTIRFSGKPTQYNPALPMFEISNTGGVNVLINDNFRLLPLTKFSLHMPTLCSIAINKGHKIEMENSFNIKMEHAPLTIADFGFNPLLYSLYLLGYFFSYRYAFVETIFTKE